jgi:hypothetical protein
VLDVKILSLIIQSRVAMQGLGLSKTSMNAEICLLICLKFFTSKKEQRMEDLFCIKKIMESWIGPDGITYMTEDLLSHLVRTKE